MCKDKTEAKDKIEKLFSGGDTLYYSDIVKKLGIDLRSVVELCSELIAEGKIYKPMLLGQTKFNLFKWIMVYEDGTSVVVVSTYDELWSNDAVTNKLPVAILRTGLTLGTRIT